MMKYDAHTTLNTCHIGTCCIGDYASCFSMPAPRAIQGRKIEVNIEAEKIVIRIHTLNRWERSLGRVTNVLVSDISSFGRPRLSPCTSIGNPDNAPTFFPGTSVEHYVYGNMLVIKISRSLVADNFARFDFVAVSFHGPRGPVSYGHRLSEFIWLTEKTEDVIELYSNCSFN